jgi:hypothetical protein
MEENSLAVETMERRDDEMKNPLPASAVALMVLFASPANASSCNQPIIVPIKFKSGTVSWHHEGLGTDFVGQFSKGQVISITAAGLMVAKGYTVEPWMLSIQGPDISSRSATLINRVN